MEIEFQNNKKDYIDYAKTILNERLKKSIIAIILISAGVAYCCYYSNYNLYISLITVIVCISIFLFGIYLVPLWKMINRLNKSIKAKPNYIELKILVVTDEGVKTEGKLTNTSILRPWENITAIKSNHKFIFITTKNKENILLSKKWFSSDDEISKFINSIQSKINVGTPTFFVKNPNRSYKSSGPPYLLGLLCFIPLIGAFVGAGLLLYGIFVYKDKWLMLIGVAGILFTVGVFKSMDYSATNSPEMKKSMAESDKGELNGLVKEIEFYKLQNGNYPDSLQQLDTKGEFTSISDPLLMFSGDKNGVFNYHKIGKKYTLFSSGIDKKPNTADDIYPSLKIDTNKIGLIIQKN